MIEDTLNYEEIAELAHCQPRTAREVIMKHPDAPVNVSLGREHAFHKSEVIHFLRAYLQEKQQ